MAKDHAADKQKRTAKAAERATEVLSPRFANFERHLAAIEAVLAGDGPIAETIQFGLSLVVAIAEEPACSLPDILLKARWARWAAFEDRLGPPFLNGISTLGDDKLALLACSTLDDLLRLGESACGDNDAGAPS